MTVVCDSGNDLGPSTIPSPGKNGAGSNLHKVPSRVMMRTQSLPGGDRDRAKPGAEGVAAAGVPLGFVTHGTGVEVGSLVVRACPQAVDVADALMACLPNASSSVEGCLDLMRSLAQDPREVCQKSPIIRQKSPVMLETETC